MTLLLSLALAASANPALVKAAGRGDVAQVRDLLEAGADPNYSGGSFARWTPLMAASEGGHVAVVRLLLEAGADPAITRGGGVRARDLTNNRQIVELLDGKAPPKAEPMPFSLPKLPKAAEDAHADDLAVAVDDEDVRARLRALGVPDKRIGRFDEDWAKRLRRGATKDSTVYIWAAAPLDLGPLAGLGAARVLVVLDAPAPESAPKGVTVLAAAAPGKPVQPGVLTRAVLEGLEVLPEATVQRLYLHVRAKVQRATRGQTPRLLGDGSWRVK